MRKWTQNDLLSIYKQKQEKTYQQIANEMDLSISRIRQLVWKGRMIQLRIDQGLGKYPKW